MWPWGHLAVGYLLYSLGARATRRGPPAAPSVLALAVGTQLPDLIDKPLTWWLPILPGGRTLGHSLVFAVPLVVLLWEVARKRRARGRVIAFAVGYASHLVGDVAHAVWIGNFWELNVLLWPITPTVFADVEPRLLWHISNVTLSPLFLAELVLAGFGLALWILDGAPLAREFLGLFRRSDHPRERE